MRSDDSTLEVPAGEDERGGATIRNKTKLVRPRMSQNRVETMAQAMTAQLGTLIGKTINCDNGRAFAWHRQIARRLAADFILRAHVSLAGARLE